MNVELSTDAAAPRRSRPDRGSPPTARHERFPSTEWNVIGLAGEGAGGDGTSGRAELESLLSRYAPALRTHLVLNRSIAPDDADDLIQGFLCDRVLADNLFARASQERGRFRYFLVTALDRHVISELRRRLAKRRQPERLLSLTGSRSGEAAREFGGGMTVPARVDLLADDPSRTFDLAWARQIVAEAVEALRTHCDATGRWEVWGVFDARVAGPCLRDAAPLGYAELVSRFGLESPAQASNILITARRMFARQLRSIVSRYAGDDGADDEIRDLRRILAGGNGGRR